MTPVPTKDEVDVKAEEAEPTVENAIQSQLARFKNFHNSISQFLVWLRIFVFCVIGFGIVLRFRLLALPLRLSHPPCPL